jgi:hypothetical protein
MEGIGSLLSLWRLIHSSLKQMAEHERQMYYAHFSVPETEKHDRVTPDWNNTVEMLLRKGAKAYRQEASTK